MAKPVCLWPRPCFFFFFFSFFFFFLVLFFVLSSLSPSSSWAACAGIPRPDLGWCPCVRVRALVATSLLLRLRLRLLLPRPRPLFCSPLFLGCVCWFTTSWPGVVSQSRGACVTGHVPFVFFFSFFFFLILLFVLSSLSPSSSWGACAGLPRPDLGGVPVLGHALLATSLCLLPLLLLLLRASFCRPPLLGVRVLVYHVLTWGGVPVLGCVCCWSPPFPPSSFPHGRLLRPFPFPLL